MYQPGQILCGTLKRMDHLPARTSEELMQKITEEEPQNLALDGAERP